MSDDVRGAVLALDGVHVEYLAVVNLLGHRDSGAITASVHRISALI